MFKHILLSIALILLSSNFAIAQPGGGGGLSIWGIYNSKLKPIDDYVKMELQQPHKEVNHFYTYNTNKKPFIVPGGNALERAIFIYKKDTMVIDFLNIIGENGAGYTDHMDSIVFKSGHFTYNRHGKQGLYELLHRGLTPSNKSELMENKMLYYQKSIGIIPPKNHSINYELLQGTFQLGNLVDNNHIQSIYRWQNFGEQRTSITFNSDRRVTYGNANELTSTNQVRKGHYMLNKKENILTIYWQSTQNPMDNSSYTSIQEKDVLKIISLNSNGLILLQLQSNATHSMFSGSPYIGFEPYDYLE